MADHGSHSDSEDPPGLRGPPETPDATNPGDATGAGDLIASLGGLTIGDAGSETPHSQDTFPFNKLPSEIREQIWEEAFKLASFLKKPRIIGIGFISRGGVSRIRVKEGFDIVQEDEFIAGLRGACQDSTRHVVQKNPVDQRLRQLNFDLNTDIIFMSIRDLHWFGDELNVDDLYNTANFMVDVMDVTVDLIMSGAFQLVDHLGQGFAAIGPFTAEQQKVCDKAAENFFQLWRRQNLEGLGEEHPSQKFIVLLNSAYLFARKYRRYVRYGDLSIIPANRSFGFRADEYLLEDDFGSEWIIESKHKVDKLRKSWHLLRKSQYRQLVPDLYFAKINAIAGPTVIFNADEDE